MGKGAIYVLLPLVAAGVVLAVALCLGWAAGQRARRAAIRGARWETYAEPGIGGQVRIGVRRVARWGVHTELVLKDDPIETVHAGDIDRRTLVMAAALDRRDFYNGLLPGIGGSDES